MKSLGHGKFREDIGGVGEVDEVLRENNAVFRA
jgi:hypothetical protein